MKKIFMLLHTGERPDLYLNLSLFLEHIGVFVYDNREVVWGGQVKREGISAFVYLISNYEMLDKFKRERRSLPHARVILTEEMGEQADYLENISNQGNEDMDVLCDDRWNSQAKFVLKYLADNKNEYKILMELYKIFQDNNLVRAYYCSEYMELEDEGWRTVLRGIMHAVYQFEILSHQILSAHIFYAQALAMKRFNDICQKIFRHKRGKWSGGSEETAVYYEYRDIMKLLQKAYMIDTNMYMALVFLADTEERMKGDSRLIQEYLRRCRCPAMMFYISYKKGLYFQRSGRENAEKMFKDSIKENKGCYRSQYKLGLILEKKNLFYQAINCYNEILTVLKSQIQKNYLHPIEYEYTVKSYFRIGFIYKRLKDLERGEFYFGKARDVLDKLKDNTFIYSFFENYIDDPVEAIQRRVSENPIRAGIKEIDKVKSGEWV